ncbi:hypothetical protein GGF32_000052 [Allomyces javanicus]|nr:hypothetical protein GGF32_000052 [Allomyces javanicus]
MAPRRKSPAGAAQAAAAATLMTPDEMALRITHIFTEAQKTKAGHRKLHNSLRKLHLDAVRPRTPEAERAFNRPFAMCLNHVLGTKRRGPTVDRVLDFVHTFIAFSREKDREMARAERAKNGRAAPPANGDEDEDLDDQDFLSNQFAAWIILYLLKGIAARDKNIRLRCARLIYNVASHLPDIDDNLFMRLKTDLYPRARDKEPMVRKEVVSALSILQGTEEDDEPDTVIQKLTELLQYDPAPVVRRAALLHVAPSNGTIAAIISRCRDEDAATRRAAYKVLADHVTHFSQLSSTLLAAILNNGLCDPDATVKRACAELVSGWVKQSALELARLLAQLNVVRTPVAETVVLECLQLRPNREPALKLTFSREYWRNLTPETALILRCWVEATNTVEDLLIEDLAYFLQLHTNNMITNDDEQLEAPLTFVVQELLTICLQADYSDLAGRKIMFELVRNMIESVMVPDDLIPPIIKLFRLISVDERDFIRIISETISDVMDNSYERRIAAGDATEDEAAMDEDAIEDDAAFRAMKCLVTVRHTLEATSQGWMADSMTPMHGLIAELIVPALQRYAAAGDIVAQCVRCLGLISLTSRMHAVQNMGQFLGYATLMSAEEDLVQVNVAALSVIGDLMVVYGAAALETNPSRVADVIARNMQSPVRALSALAVEAAVKLLLSNRLQDPKLLSLMIVQYFTPETQSFPDTYQCLQFFVQTYSTILANKQHLATVFPRVLSTLATTEFGSKATALNSIGTRMSPWLECSDGGSANLQLRVTKCMLEAALDGMHDAGDLPLKPALQICSKWLFDGLADAGTIRTIRRLLERIPERSVDTVTVKAIQKLERALVRVYPADADAAEALDEDPEPASAESTAPPTPAARGRRVASSTPAMVLRKRSRPGSSSEASTPGGGDAMLAVTAPATRTAAAAASAAARGARRGLHTAATPAARRTIATRASPIPLTPDLNGADATPSRRPTRRNARNAPTNDDSDLSDIDDRVAGAMTPGVLAGGRRKAPLRGKPVAPPALKPAATAVAAAGATGRAPRRRVVEVEIPIVVKRKRSAAPPPPPPPAPAPPSDSESESAGGSDSESNDDEDVPTPRASRPQDIAALRRMAPKQARRAALVAEEIDDLLANESSDSDGESDD